MKKQVDSMILKDMERYIEDFNPDDYEISINTTPSVILYLKEYYNTHLPVDVSAWIRVNKPCLYMVYAEELDNQVSFICNVINKMLRESFETRENIEPQVIKTHYSKSIQLPVYQIKLEKHDIEIILRGNFYDWVVSIKSKRPLNLDFMSMFKQKEETPSFYFYKTGLPRDKVYGSYEQNHSKFTIEIASNYDLYTFFFLLKNYLEIEN